MTILLTGASGFMGRHVLKQLLNAGHTVIAPVRESSANKVAEKPGAHFTLIKGDFFDDAVLQEAAALKPETIIHMASVRGAGQGDNALYEQVNVHGTKTLLAFAQSRGLKKFVYISSVGVLGTIPENVPARPSDKPQPDGIYHQTKYRAEQLVQQAAGAGLKTLILRPTITYGEGDDGFIAKMISMIQKGIFIYPANDVRIHLLHVTTFAKWLAEAVKKLNTHDGVFHCCDREPVLLNDVVQVLAKRFVNKNYPSLKRLPSFLFGGAAGLCALLKKDNLKTSFDLIHKDWFYDISDAEKQLAYMPAETLYQLENSPL